MTPETQKLSVYIAGNGGVSKSFQAGIKYHVKEVLVGVRGDPSNGQYVVGNLQSVQPNSLGIIATTLSGFTSALGDFQRNNIPTVITTTGYPGLVHKNYSVSLLEASNLTLPVVELLQIFSSFQDFSSFSIMVEESHQEAKQDQSGTAIDIVKLFQSKGGCLRKEIISYRGNDSRLLQVPERYITEHAYHTYTVMGSGENFLQFTRELLMWEEKNA